MIKDIPKTTEEFFHHFHRYAARYRWGGWAALGAALLVLGIGIVLLVETALRTFVLDDSLLKDESAAIVKEMRVRAEAKAQDLERFLSIGLVWKRLDLPSADLPGGVSNIYWLGEDNLVAVGYLRSGKKPLTALWRWNDNKIAWQRLDSSILQTNGFPADHGLTARNRLVIIVKRYGDNREQRLLRMNRDGSLVEDLTENLPDLKIEHIAINLELGMAAVIGTTRAIEQGSKGRRGSQNGAPAQTQLWLIDLDAESSQPRRVRLDKSLDVLGAVNVYEGRLQIINRHQVVVAEPEGPVWVMGLQADRRKIESKGLPVASIEGSLFALSKEPRPALWVSRDLATWEKVKVEGLETVFKDVGDWRLIRVTAERYPAPEGQVIALRLRFVVLPPQPGRQPKRIYRSIVLWPHSGDEPPRRQGTALRGHVVDGVGNRKEIWLAGWTQDQGGRQTREAFVVRRDDRGVEQVPINVKGAIYGMLALPDSRILAVGEIYEVVGRRPLVMLYDEHSWLRIRTVTNEARLYDLKQLSEDRVIAFGRIDTAEWRVPVTWVSERHPVPPEVRTSMRKLVDYLTSDRAPIREGAWIDRELPQMQEDAASEERAQARLARLKKAAGSGEVLDWKVLTISSLLRVALIAILFFVAQVFVNLYRYLLRIAVFYEACGKAVALASDEKSQIPSPETLSKLIATLTPNHIDFDQIPKPMLESIIAQAGKLR